MEYDRELKAFGLRLVERELKLLSFTVQNVEALGLIELKMILGISRHRGGIRGLGGIYEVSFLKHHRAGLSTTLME